MPLSEEVGSRWRAHLDAVTNGLLRGPTKTSTSRTIEQAGFTVEHLDSYYFTGEPKPFGYTFEGRAVKH